VGGELLLDLPKRDTLAPPTAFVIERLKEFHQQTVVVLNGRKTIFEIPR